MQKMRREEQKNKKGGRKREEIRGKRKRAEKR